MGSPALKTAAIPIRAYPRIRRRMRAVCTPGAFAGRALSERESASRTGPSAVYPSSAGTFPTFSFPCESNLRKVRKLNPLFSIYSALFCAFAQLTFPPNPFIFCRLRTFLDDYRGWGYLNFPTSGVPSSAITRRRNARNELHLNHLLSIACKRVRKILKTSTFKSLYFHTHAHSSAASPVFSITSQKHTGGYTPKSVRFWDLPPARRAEQPARPSPFLASLPPRFLASLLRPLFRARHPLDAASSLGTC